MFCADGSSSKGSFLQQKKAAREDRAHEKRREAAATLIQAHIRAWLARARFAQRIL
jgi:ubiquitin-protein ligase E3 B